jgi:hypothetical protein
MDDKNQKDKNDLTLTRRGFTVYMENPSLANAFPVKVKSQPSKKLENAYMVAPGTGEVVAQGAFAFVEEKLIDSEQFVKVYLEGIRQYGQLSKAGALLFEFVYREISGRKDQDKVTLNYQLAMMWKPDLGRSTFFRGMKELLEKEFLFRHVAADTYFVNVRFMFNGNRMVLVKSYSRNSNNKNKSITQSDQLAIGSNNED